MKIKADFNRYITEYEKGIEREKASNTALKTYQEAMNLTKNMNIMNKILLGLALNFSIFQYEVIGERKNAIAIGDDVLQKVDKEMPAH